MRTTLFATSVALLIATLGLVTGCEKDGGSASTPGDGDKTLVVGGILSLSGGAATYGQAADRGARLAVDQINARQGGLKVEYLPRDDKSDQREAADLAQNLIMGTHVHAMLGPAISPSAISVGKLADEQGVPIVATSATQNDITASDSYDRTFVFRVCFSDDLQARMLARFAYSELDRKQAVIVLDKTLSYSTGLAKSFSEEYETMGGRIAHRENYSVSDTDYSVLINKVASYAVDLVFIAGWDENVGPMLKQAGRKWDNFTILGADGCATERLLELAGRNTLNSYASSHFAFDGTPRKMVDDFISAYEQCYGEKPSQFAALGYDTMMLIYDAATRAGKLDRAAIRQAIANTDGLELVTDASLRWAEHRNPLKPVYIVKIHPDHFEFVKQMNP